MRRLGFGYTFVGTTRCPVKTIAEYDGGRTDEIITEAELEALQHEDPRTFEDIHCQTCGRLIATVEKRAEPNRFAGGPRAQCPDCGTVWP